MTDLTVWTYDWVPPPPRGFVRDLRLRWACEEAGLAYTVRTVPFENRGEDHLARQPFAQIPFLSVLWWDIYLAVSGLPGPTYCQLQLMIRCTGSLSPLISISVFRKKIVRSVF